jgi:uncharacterized protein DUF1425
MSARGLLIAGLAGSVGIVGCAQRRYDPPPSVIADPASYPQVVVSPDLTGWLAASRPVVTRGEEGTGVLRVTVPVRTLVARGQTVRVQYRFIFLDGLGRPISPEGDWQYVRMPANTQRFFEGNALDDKASDWRLEIRTAR